MKKFLWKFAYAPVAFGGFVIVYTKFLFDDFATNFDIECR